MRTTMEMRDRIRAEMETLGLTQKELAKKAGLNETYIRDLLEGRSQDPKLSKIQAVAVALGKSLEWLTDGAESAEVIGIMKRISDRKRQQITEYARFLAAQDESKAKK